MIGAIISLKPYNSWYLFLPAIKIADKTQSTTSARLVKLINFNILIAMIIIPALVISRDSVIDSHVVSGVILTGISGVPIDLIICSMSSGLLFLIKNIYLVDSPHIFSEMI